MLRTVLLSAVTATILLTGIGYGGDTKTRAISGLLSADPLTRQAAFDRVVAERARTVQELISVLGRKGIDKSYQGPLHRAIVLLGKLRAREAVAPLSKFLLYVPVGFETEEEIPIEAYHVAAVALAEIGFPAIDAMCGHSGSTTIRCEQSTSSCSGREPSLTSMVSLWVNKPCASRACPSWGGNSGTRWGCSFEKMSGMPSCPTIEPLSVRSGCPPRPARTRNLV